MTLEQARQALGAAAALPIPADSACGFVTPAGWSPDVSLMVVEGRIARVDVSDTSFATDLGARVGDDATRIEQLYAGRVRVQPHKYTSGRYLIVPLAAGRDSTLRLVFETDSAGRVTTFRGGRLPEVEWVERCG